MFDRMSSCAKTLRRVNTFLLHVCFFSSPLLHDISADFSFSSLSIFNQCVSRSQKAIDPDTARSRCRRESVCLLNIYVCVCVCCRNVVPKSQSWHLASGSVDKASLIGSCSNSILFAWVCICAYVCIAWSNLGSGLMEQQPLCLFD